MSTRCQVEVVQEDLEQAESVMLYRHFDGYCENVLPLFVKAYEIGKAVAEEDGLKAYYILGRAGKVASFLCAAHPGHFEPEAGPRLHFDIEYFYRLYVVNGHKEHKLPYRWYVQVFVPGEGFAASADPADLIPIGERMFVQGAAKVATELDAKAAAISEG